MSHAILRVTFTAWANSWAGIAVWCVLGILLLFTTLHLVRALGRMHAALAKQLLVKSARI